MHEVETYSFGEWLKQRRGQLRLTQRDLAANVYCSVAMIKKIEADERRPSFELAELLANSLQVPQAQHEIFIEVARGNRPVDYLQQGSAAFDSSSAPVPLPEPSTPLVGREDELTQIGARLAQPNCRLLTLVGPGGMGKTRLAIEAARSQDDTFDDGVAFVALAAITDASLIPDAIARSLRLTLTGPAAEQVLAYLQQRNMLLVLDNCEQLDGDLTWLSELLTHAMDVKLLATSRERLHLSEEWVYVVPELAQAVDLFTETAQRIKQDFEIKVEKTAIIRICELVENLPLAVELAASWTPLMACAQIADHIEQGINILETEMRNVPERHRSVQAVFDHSWHLLSSAEQDALMRLSVFRGGWQAEQAMAVADADLRLLRRLVNKSLVRVSENGRYDLHVLIRQYTSQKLAGSELELETRQRHFDAYLALAKVLDAQQAGPQSMEAVIRLDQEQENIRAALIWGLDSKQVEPTLHLLKHLGLYWIRRGYWHEGVQWASRAIHQAGEHESAALSIVLSYAALFAFILGRFSEMEPLALRALAIAHRLEDTEALIAGYGTYTVTSVNAEQALDGLHKGIVLIEETGKMQQILPEYYVVSASWFHSSGRYDKARDYYQKAIDLYRQRAAVDRITEPLFRLGQLSLQEGRLQEAYDLTVESTAATRAAGIYDVFGRFGGALLGAIQLYLGQIDAAERSLEEVLRWPDDGRLARLKQEALAILSEVMLARGNVTKAVDHLEACLNICRQLYHQLQATQKLEGTPDALPIDIIALSARASLVASAQGQYERAVTLYNIAEIYRVQSGQSIPPPLQMRLEEAMTAARAQLSAAAYDSARDAGQAMSLADAFAFLLG